MAEKKNPPSQKPGQPAPKIGDVVLYRTLPLLHPKPAVVAEVYESANPNSNLTLFVMDAATGAKFIQHVPPMGIGTAQHGWERKTT